MKTKKSPASAESIGGRIDEILGVPQIGELVRRYLDPGIDNEFAGTSFDTLGRNRRKAFEIDDLIVLNLLDERLSGPAIRRLLSGELDTFLAQVPEAVDLWDASDQDLGSTDQLLDKLKALPGVGSTRAAKLCARKRPRMFPIYDSVVERVMCLNNGPWRRPLAEALADSDRRAGIRKLDPELDGYTPSVLRLLDVAIWMVGSNATTARNAREAAGLSDPKPIW